MHEAMLFLTQKKRERETLASSKLLNMWHKHTFLNFVNPFSNPAKNSKFLEFFILNIPHFLNIPSFV